MTTTTQDIETFDEICGDCDGLRMADITVDDVRAQCEIAGANDERTESALRGLAARQEIEADRG